MNSTYRHIKCITTISFTLKLQLFPNEKVRSVTFKTKLYSLVSNYFKLTIFQMGNLKKEREMQKIKRLISLQLISICPLKFLLILWLIP